MVQSCCFGGTILIHVEVLAISLQLFSSGVEFNLCSVILVPPCFSFYREDGGCSLDRLINKGLIAMAVQVLEMDNIHILISQFCN